MKPTSRMTFSSFGGLFAGPPRCATAIVREGDNTGPGGAGFRAAPFIPGHEDTCKCRYKFPTTCPWCERDVMYIQCTCHPRPSKVYLPLDGDIRHSKEHGCNQMRRVARDSVLDLLQNQSRRHTPFLDTLQELEEKANDNNEREKNLKNRRIRTDAFKLVVRKTLAEEWVKALAREWIKALQCQGTQRPSIEATLRGLAPAALPTGRMQRSHIEAFFNGRESDSYEEFRRVALKVIGESVSTLSEAGQVGVAPASKSKPGIESESKVESGRSSFAVQLGPFNSEKCARDTVDELCQRGYGNARVEPVRSGKFCVRIVGFQDRNAANGVRDKLAGLGYPGAEVTPKPREPFPLPLG